MPFVDVAQSGYHAEQNRDRVARSAFSRFGRLARPIAPITRLCVFGQSMSAVRTLHRVRIDFRLLRRCVCVFHRVVVSFPAKVTTGRQFVKQT